MADEDTTAGGEGGEGKEPFNPESLSPEAQEYIRRKAQSDSDTKTALAEKRLRDEQATRARGATQAAERNELLQLASSGQHEALGQRVAARLNQSSAEEAAVFRASDLIEKQMADKFSETLGPEKVEEIRQETVKAGGAHAEFAEGLAKATEGKTRAEEITAEVKAQLTEQRTGKRDEDSGADKATGGGQGPKPSTDAEIEQAYIDGTLGATAAENRKVYEKHLEASGKGR